MLSQLSSLFPFLPPKFAVLRILSQLREGFILQLLSANKNKLSLYSACQQLSILYLSRQTLCKMDHIVVHRGWLNLKEC